MMSHTVPIEDAPARIIDLISNLQPGDEVTITRHSTPVARIIPEPAPRRRQPGLGKGLFTIVREDDDHLQDFKEYMP